MNIAIIGCGYVADFYMASLRYHPEIKLITVYDNNPQRLKEFCAHYSVKPAVSLEAILNDSSVSIVLNLTNPRAHYDINKQSLLAGKHVYSEKPLAMSYQKAKELVSLAQQQKRYLSSAPCSLLGETAQTILAALDENVIGKVRLVYANFDAGMPVNTKPWLWRSHSGAAWPAKDEFEVGCTYEHAAYIFTWLAAFFGPAESVSAFASNLAPDKGVAVDTVTPDFTVGCVKYPGNIVARVTCSLVAPSDRSLTIVGDKGTLYVKDIRDDASPVYIRHASSGCIKNALQYRINHWQNRVERYFNWLPWSWGNSWQFSKRYPFATKPQKRSSGKYKPVDFCRGPAELARAIKDNDGCKLSPEFCAHIIELTEALQYPERFQRAHKMQSTFPSINFYSG